MTSTKPNRNPIKQWFFTFPKSNITKEDFASAIEDLRQPDYYKVALEHHADGSPHLHAVVKFTTGVSKTNLLKKIRYQFPDDYKRIDIQPVRSIQKSIEYISKEDPQPIENRPYTGVITSERKKLHSSIIRLYNIDNGCQVSTISEMSDHAKRRLEAMEEQSKKNLLELKIQEKNFVHITNGKN